MVYSDWWSSLDVGGRETCAHVRTQPGGRAVSAVELITSRDGRLVRFHTEYMYESENASCPFNTVNIIQIILGDV